MMNSDNDVKVLAAVRAIKHSKIEPFLETLNKLKTHSNPSIHRAVKQTMSAHPSN
jgi:hypothetical protein